MMRISLLEQQQKKPLLCQPGLGWQIRLVFLLTVTVVVSLIVFLPQPVRAATKRYTAEWRATKLLVMRLHEAASQRDGRWEARDYREVFPIAFGVAEWKVAGGYDDGSQFFREIWSVPKQQIVFTNKAVPVDNWGKNSVRADFHRSKDNLYPYGDDSGWLYGLYMRYVKSGNPSGSDTFVHHFVTEQPRTEEFSGQGGEYRPSYSLGPAVACYHGVSCVFPTGQYSMVYAMNLAQAKWWYYNAIITTIPLRWTVEGRACSNPCGD